LKLLEVIVKQASSKALRCALVLGSAFFLFTACYTTDDARVLQILNERGFGRKYSGNANELFYYGVGDSFTFADTFNVELQGSLTIRMDGTVNFPQIGETYVAGLTSKEIASMLDTRFAHYYKYISITVIPGNVVSKKIFVHLDTDKNMVVTFRGDQTLYDLVQSVNYDSIDVDLDNIKVVRADPVHPLVIYCDIDDMTHGGYSRDNILLREDDIIYFTPSIVGYLKLFVKTILSPLQPAVQLITGVNRMDMMIDTFGEGVQAGGRYGRGGYGGGYGY